MPSCFRWALVLGTLAFIGQPLGAQPNLQQKLKDTGLGAHWIYDDFAQAKVQAKATGKPILALFR